MEISSALGTETGEPTGSNRLRSRRHGGGPGIVVLASLVAGFLTLVGHEWLTSPWDLVANSIGAWCLFPFFAGRRTTSLWRGGAAGVACLLALNLGYYISLPLLTGRGDFASRVFFWVLAAFPIGLVLGMAGNSSTRGARAWSVVSAIPGAIFIYEVSLWFELYHFWTWQADAIQALWVAAGLVITATLARAPGHRVRAFAALPVFVLGAAGAWKIAFAIFRHVTSTL
jgi:Family of unknown function (DUF6518)